MIAALSPVMSWLLFLACIAVGVTVYVVVAGGRRYRRMERQAATWRRGIEVAPRVKLPAGIDPPSPVEPTVIRILGGVYDHEARGDFR